MRFGSFLFFLLLPCMVIAAPNQQSGDLELEDTTEQKKKSPYAVNQENAIEWVRALSSGAAKEADDGVLLNLAVSYLYCTVKTGMCSYLLDTVLEADLKRSGTECSTMKRFWKAWLANDLEQRLKYMLPIGYVSSVGTFNASERPKYVKCEAKLAELKSGKESRSAQIAKTLKFLEDVKTKEINVMLATGVIGGQAPKGDKQ